MLRSRIALTTRLADWSNLILEGNLNNLYTKTETKELGQGQEFTGGLYALGHRVKENYFLKAMVTAEREIAPGLDINGFIGGEIQRTTASFNTGQTSGGRSEEHTSALQSLMRISYDVFCLKKTKKRK